MVQSYYKPLAGAAGNGIERNLKVFRPVAYCYSVLLTLSVKVGIPLDLYMPTDTNGSAQRQNRIDFGVSNYLFTKKMHENEKNVLYIL